jgi:hypothetical protein
MTQAELIELIELLIKNGTSNQKSRNAIASDVAKQYLRQSGCPLKEDIISDIDNHYFKEGLVELAKYVRKMVNANKNWLESLNLKLPYDLVNKIDINTAPKAKLVWSVAVIFSKPEVMRKFHAELPEALQKAFEQLTWISEAKAEVLSDLIGIPTTKKKSSSYYDSSVEISQVFKALPHKIESWNGNITFAWPAHLREFLRGVYPVPESFYIKTISEPPGNLLRWEEGEVVIFEEIQKLLAYRLQGAITVNTSGKVAATAFKKMRKTLGVREFVPDEESFSLLRTTCLAQMLASYEPKKNQINIDSLEILKQLRKTLDKDFNILFLLNDLKNHGYVNLHYYKRQAEKTLIEWMERLPKNEWVSVENLTAYAQIHDLKMQPASPSEYQSLAYEVPSQFGSHTNKLNISGGNAYFFVERPALLSSFFLMAALGWLDIAYEAPNGTFAEDYYSSYDGLKCVRLNDLGAYIFGRSPAGEYTPKVNKATQELVFDDQSLLIFCDPENAVAETVLANYAERVSSTRFRVTADTFLKDCKSRSQLMSKITLFQKSVAPHLPPNWHHFFDDLLVKAEPLRAVSDLLVFQIPSTNQTLIRLLAQDPVLKTLVIKAEGFRVLVAQNQQVKFKNRLRELGYLM